MEEIFVDNRQFQGLRVALPHSSLLLITGNNGFLGCGYFDTAVADKVGEMLAVVSGVKTFDDMLNAKVIKVSQKAAALGVETGMSGKAALLLMNK